MNIKSIMRVVICAIIATTSFFLGVQYGGHLTFVKEGLDGTDMNNNPDVRWQLPVSASSKLEFESVDDDCMVSLDTNNGESSEKRQSAFNDVYKNKIWGNKDTSGSGGSSGSGGGSTIAVAKYTIDYLTEFIELHDIRSFADIPCGEMTWQSEIPQIRNSEVLYFGGDVSSYESVIPYLKKNFANDTMKLFRRWDLVKCPVPTFMVTGSTEPQHFDMVLTRDVIQHMNWDYGMRFIRNVVLTNVSYWAVTSFPGDNEGGEHLQNGAYYKNNLEKPPFSLTMDIIFKKESHPPGPRWEEDFLLIYNVTEDLKRAVREWKTNS